jgi:glycosyltransferase involved in cell wall biosynthesis
VKILHTVEFFYPSVGGAQEVIKQISDQLTSRGHEVIIATSFHKERKNTSINNSKVSQFNIWGNNIKGFHGEISYYQQFLLDNNFDIMLNYAAQQWATDLTFPMLNKLSYPKILAPVGFSKLKSKEYASYFSSLPKYLEEYNHFIFHSNTYQDINFVKNNGFNNYSVISNGASKKEFLNADHSFRTRYKINQNHPMLLTVGNHTRKKGHTKTIFAFLSSKIGSSTLIIIGKRTHWKGCHLDCFLLSKFVELATHGSKRVLLLDIPRRDVVAAFWAADLFIFPSNIEYSPLVLFEAMASKTPFIASDCGNTKEIVKWSNGGIVLPSFAIGNGYIDVKIKDLINSIEELISNPAKRESMAINGFNSWINNFTWEIIASKYENLYINLISEKNKFS